MPRIERTNEKYNLAFVKSIRRADREAPEKYIRNLDELIEYLAEEIDTGEKKDADNG